MFLAVGGSSSLAPDAGLERDFERNLPAIAYFVRAAFIFSLASSSLTANWATFFSRSA